MSVGVDHIMRICQFFFLEADDLFHGLEVENESLASSNTLFETLITDFSALPDSQADIDYDHYAVVNVNPSVVPNPYLPSFRVFAYNITGLTDVLVSGVGHDPYQEEMRTLQRRNRAPHNHGSDAGECEKTKSWRCKLERPWHSNTESPSRKNTLWSPLGYAQVCL
jgi:endopolyphosphatase